MTTIARTLTASFQNATQATASVGLASGCGLCSVSQHPKNDVSLTSWWGDSYRAKGPYGAPSVRNG